MTSVAMGDNRALTTLINRHSQRLHAYLVRYTQSKADADDLLQESWIRVARSARRFDPSRRFRSWLYGIATNLARDLFRKRGMRERALLDRTSFSTQAEGRNSTIAERSELLELVGQLPDRMREVVLLRFYEGMNESEMATVLGIAKGTVKSRLHSALRFLREDYGDTR